MKRHIIELNAGLLVALLLLICFPLPAAAEGSGTLCVYLHTVETGEVIPDAKLEVYCVADYADGDITLTEDFAATGLTLTDMVDDLSGSVERLDAYMSSTTAKPLRTGLTGSDGRLYFDGLADGVYYVRYVPDEETDAAYSRTVSIKSFIVAIPTLDGDALLREVTCKPKCELVGLTEISVTKIWKDENWDSRPDSVQISLYNGDKCVETVKLDADNGWTYVWESMDETGDYSVREQNIPEGYTCSISTSDTNVFVVTNTLDRTPGSKTDTPKHHPKAGTPNHPKTGDESSITLWVTLMAASATAGLCCLLWVRRPGKRQ
ncbi:MAG: Cna B-type domain-containing protein [Oscillospiraceae bacterium]|nr:Cna B-type domain-containing protein [Oscillospiraceae bacterium]